MPVVAVIKVFKAPKEVDLLDGNIRENELNGASRNCSSYAAHGKVPVCYPD